ncbi:uncharacterized protein [Montipora capricornis]|uniref:uncharacterized protein n=1 Tax=Montipora capricornis TaxID=246305 RepID=UPI0035F103A0
MSTHGKLEEFDRNSDTWELCIERFNFYFEANKIGGEGNRLKLRRGILLSSVGKKTYKLMCDLLAPEKPGDKPYAELCTIVKNHFNPKTSESEQRHKLNNPFRSNGESISDFVAALQHLAEYCNVGGSLENMLRERLVSGVNNEKIQSCLLSEGELTFKKAFEIALSLETTAQHMVDLLSTPSTSAMASASVKKGKVPSLFGRDWLQHVKLQCSENFHLSALSPEVSSLLGKQEALSKDGLRTVQGVKEKIHVDPQAKPKYFKPRPVAYALRQKVEEELDRLLSEGTIRPVEFSEWATAIVPIVKSDGTIRICGDFLKSYTQ